MTMPPVGLQDLRRRIYVKAKADAAGSGGVGRGCTRRLGSLSSPAPWVPDESSPSMTGPITLAVKCAGKRCAGNPHAAFDVAGAGNGITAGAH